MADTRLTPFTAVKLTEPARTSVRTSTAWVIGLARRRVTISTALRALIAVAERHPDEVMKELARIEAEEIGA